MSWPWNTPQSHLFHPPPPLPPPSMPTMGFPHPQAYPQQPVNIPFGSFSSPHQPHQAPPPPPPPFFNQPPSEYGPPPDVPPYNQNQWAPYAYSHAMPSAMPSGARGHHISYPQQLQMQMQMQRGRPRMDPRRRAQTVRRKNGIDTDGVSDKVRGMQKRAGERAVVDVTRVRTSGEAGGSKHGSDGNMRDAAVSKAVLDKLGAKLPQDEKEIERWVAERKRNWPSRANVERKMKEKEERERKGALERENGRKGAIDKLREGYGSSEDEEGEKRRGRREGSGDGRRRGEVKKRRRGRARGGAKGGNGLVGRGAEMHGAGRKNLLKQLLEKEIHKETSVLLQAFKYLASRDGG